MVAGKMYQRLEAKLSCQCFLGFFSFAVSDMIDDGTAMQIVSCFHLLSLIPTKLVFRLQFRGYQNVQDLTPLHLTYFP